jgi:hypothetical protein
MLDRGALVGIELLEVCDHANHGPAV